MAKGRRSSKASAASRVSHNRSLTRSALSTPTRLALGSLLSDVDDGRVWHPDPDRGAITVGGRWARVVVHKRPAIAYSKPLWSYRGLPVGLQPPVGVRFESPLRVVTCIRRKVRREVIFARGRAGKGVAKRRPRRSWKSDIGC